MRNLDNIIVQVSFAELMEYVRTEIDREVKMAYDKLSAKLEAKPTTMSTNEVLAYLNISRPTLYRWEQKQVLVPNKVGKKKLYNTHDVELLVKHNYN